MRVLHVSPSIEKSYGGPTKSLAAYLTASAKAGIEAHVAAPRSVLMLGKSDCEACASWTEELSKFLESDEAKAFGIIDEVFGKRPEPGEDAGTGAGDVTPA